MSQVHLAPETPPIAGAGDVRTSTRAELGARPRCAYVEGHLGDCQNADSAADTEEINKQLRHARGVVRAEQAAACGCLLPRRNVSARKIPLALVMVALATLTLWSLGQVIVVEPEGTSGLVTTRPALRSLTTPGGAPKVSPSPRDATA